MPRAKQPNEMESLTAVINALRPFNHEQRNRIIDAAMRFLKESQPAPTPRATGIHVDPDRK